ncbi:MAG TPA: ATP-dependent helicase HrpB [Geobacteraceae bacterium]
MSTPMQKLPIDDLLPQFLAALDAAPCVVLQAPPGAGKTTRIPLALLKAPFLKEKRIVMLEPRRLAAVNAARWMAASLGEEAGGTVGYAIRFERRVSRGTRIEVVTEGILSRRLQADPYLTGVGVVIFDEFHERNLNSDLALALCRDVQKGVRDDLKLVVMSATLESAPLAALLDNAPVIAAQGKSFPVDIRYLSREDGGDVAAAASRGTIAALKETEGDILVFLPGAGEIRRCQRLLDEDPALPRNLLIRPLFGDLPFAAQEEAIMPADRRRVVLATNIAETSLTIEGVRVVVDTGFCRVLRFDPATGLNRLVTTRISAASAEQRAGRAGRLGPGTCFRLWTPHTQATLLPFSQPEIRCTDLAPLALELAEWGIKDAATLDWLDPPPAATMEEGRRLLQRLGALDGKGVITVHGSAMASLPLHPRLAHMLFAGKERGMGELACELAALLAERDIYRIGGKAACTHKSPSDLLDRVESLREWRKAGRAGSGGEIDQYLARSVDRVSRELRTLLTLKESDQEASAENVAMLLVLAFPDRIARQREEGSERYLLANGKGAQMSGRSAVRGAPFIVAVVLEGGERGDGAIHQASALPLQVLRHECAGEFERRRLVEWDAGEGRVIAREEERLGSITVASRQVTPTADELVEAILEGVRRGPGIMALNWTPQAKELRARVEFLGRLFPGEGWPDFSDAALLAALPALLLPFVDRVRNLADLGRIDSLPLLKAMLTWEQSRRLDEGAPTHVAVPSGSRITLHYSPDSPPVLAVKLQELFGLAETPTVAWGRVPVLLHLLSPAGRPIQVTGDLRNFWNTVYPQVKKELKGRYPKHPWPDDPWTAVPTRHAKRRVKSKG